MARVAARRPNDHHHPPAQIADRLITNLSIVKPRIPHVDMATGEHQRRVQEIETALAKRGFPLGWIEGNLHCNICTPKKSGKPDSTAAQCNRHSQW